MARSYRHDMISNNGRRAATLALATLTAVTAVALPASPAAAATNPVPVTAIVSATPSGKAANNASNLSDTSTGGRYVAFTSNASDLVAGDTNGVSDVFVRDTLTAATIRVSVGAGGVQGTGSSSEASISRDGRYVAFRSAATNLVASDTNSADDVFVRDLRYQTTTRVSVPSGVNGQAQGGDSSRPSLSADGHTVAFESAANNLVGGDTNATSDVFVRDLTTTITERASVTSAEAQLTQGATTPSLSGTGRYVVFTSSTNEVGTFSDGYNDVFLRDLVAGTTERVSLTSDATHPDGLSDAGTVSDDGRYVAFKSMAGNLTMYDDAAGKMDVFVRDRTTATTDLVSRSTANAAATIGATDPSISADGTKVVFTSSSTNLVAGDTNGKSDVFVRSLTGATSRWSLSSVGAQLTAPSAYASLSPDGTAVSFATDSPNPYGTDTNGTIDVYVRTTFQTGPWAASTDLVQRSAKDFNGSTLSPAALTATDNRLLFGTATPASLIVSYAHGTFDDHRGPVMRLYWAFFKRAPDLGGLNYWATKHQKGTSIKAIANSFAQSSEFKTNFGYGTDSEFITLVYQNVLERNPDAAGLAHWVAKMKAGTTRGEMMTNFSESSEGTRKMRGEVDTVLVILGMLHRVPSSGEVISYANALELQGGQPTEVLVNAILTGGEYAATVT
jgi:Tol biopolymer transport system component